MFDKSKLGTISSSTLLPASGNNTHGFLLHSTTTAATILQKKVNAALKTDESNK